jgi:UDPglucose 6-dehydrogenase
MDICVAGTGYVGLVLGACLAGSGNRVVCTDIDEEKVRLLNEGILPIFEPGLQDIVARNLRAGRLSFSRDVGEWVGKSDVIFIAVGTPASDEGTADLSQIDAVATTIGQSLSGPTIVVTKSTVPVGTSDRILKTIRAVNPEADVVVVSNPEFLKEGHAVEDFLRPDRIVVGTLDSRAREVISEIYAPFTRTSNRIQFMDVRSSEMTKYAANAMLATRISFMNEMASLCEAVGADVELVRRGVGSDPRIGGKFLFPGAGFGGSCLPKDVRALLGTAKRNGREMPILEAVLAVNERQKKVLLKYVDREFPDGLKGLTLAIWGLSFKPRTDDVREAPALEIIRTLLDRGARVRAADPVAIDNTRAIFGDDVAYFEDEYEAAEGADALLVVTEWSQYRQPDFERLQATMRRPIVLDGRNLYDPRRLEKRGFTYYCIGRPPVNARKQANKSAPSAKSSDFC